MPYSPVVVEQFGGLNLLGDPIEVGMTGAVDLINVDFDRPGRVRARNGLSNILSPPGSSANGIAGFEKTDGTRQYVIGYTTGGVDKLGGYGAPSTLIATQSISAGNSFSAARFGDTSNERLYVANGTDRIWRWDGSAFTQPAGIPTAKLVAVTPVSNRLVVATTGAGSATMGASKTSRVAFSDAGAPETWTYAAGPPESGNFVDLTPGDGSPIVGLVAWRELLFAFKRDRFFVFQGESTNSAGQPIFNYRPVDGYGAVAGAGVSLTPKPVAGEEGVYFFDGKTVWLTTGSVPVRVGRPVEAFLQGLVSINGVTANVSTGVGLTDSSMSYVGGRLYLGVDTSGSAVTLVFDPKVTAWTAYQAASLGAMTAVFGLRVPFTDEVAIGVLHNTSRVTRLGAANVDDNGTAISWAYQSGFYDLAAGQRAVVGQTDVTGTGTVTYQLLSEGANPSRVADSGSSVVLGTSPGVATTRRRRAVTGRRHAHKLSGSGPAMVSKLVHAITGVERGG